MVCTSTGRKFATPTPVRSVVPNLRPPPYTPTTGVYLPNGPPPPLATARYPLPHRMTVSPSFSILNTLGPRATQLTCPYCHAVVLTTVESKVTKTAWVACLLICLLGCVCGCCLVPLCMDRCRSTEHTCPNCHRFLTLSTGT